MPTAEDVKSYLLYLLSGGAQGTEPPPDWEIPNADLSLDDDHDEWMEFLKEDRDV